MSFNLSTRKTKQQVYRSGFSFFINSHYLALRKSLKEIYRQTFSFCIAILAIATILSLPATIYLLIDNVKLITSHLNTNPTLSLFLKKEISKEQVSTITKELRLTPNVINVTYTPPEQGIKELNIFSHNPDLRPFLSNSTLPGVINITLSPHSYDSNTLHQLRNLIKSPLIIDQSQLDAPWLKRLGFIMTLTKRISLTLLLFFAIIVTLAISHVTQLTHKTNQQDTEVLQFLGATKPYIRRPYLYCGLITGLASGLLAWLFSSVTSFWVTPPLYSLLSSYQIVQDVRPPLLPTLAFLTLVSAALGLLGGRLSMKKQAVSEESPPKLELSNKPC